MDSQRLVNLTRSLVSGGKKRRSKAPLLWAFAGVIGGLVTGSVISLSACVRRGGVIIGSANVLV